jgi:hypothetical protein
MGRSSFLTIEPALQPSGGEQLQRFIHVLAAALESADQRV